MSAEQHPRISGLMLLPLAWLIMTMLASALVVALYFTAVTSPTLRQTLFSSDSNAIFQWALSLATSLAVWIYSMWVIVIFCKRSRRLPRHYIIWTLLSLLLAVKTFAFSPVTDANAVRTLIIALLAAVILVPYFKRSARVKATFTQ